ncbi:MAG: DNA-directed RNA polymerase subunit alpha [Synergistales bacterium]|nr:DNA-directed RNA polymerase subunit alpha [Synergistales bacterium]
MTERWGETVTHVQPQIRVEESTPRSATVVFEPLERGYGVTLGNALRRVLLSSIGGAAITAVRIEGVLHEYSTIPGVREDVIELLLNMKHVPVRCHSEEVRILRIEIDGPGQVTAGDIQADSEVEFPDPDAYLCTIAEGTHLAMDLFIERGTGYATVDREKPPYLPVDALMIDAIFSPIYRVNYEIENARVGQRTDYDRLKLNVVTNAVTDPAEAVGKAARILKGYFTQTADELSAEPEPPEEEAAAEGSDEAPEGQEQGRGAARPEIRDDAFLSRPVRDLELSIRSENCLLRGGVHTVGDLVGRSRDELLKIRNLGKISLREIEEKLEAFGYTLRPAGSESRKKQQRQQQQQESDEESQAE